MIKLIKESEVVHGCRLRNRDSLSRTKGCLYLLVFLSGEVIAQIEVLIRNLGHIDYD